AEDGIRDFHVTGVQTCALPISRYKRRNWPEPGTARHPRCPDRRRETVLSCSTIATPGRAPASAGSAPPAPPQPAGAESRCPSRPRGGNGRNGRPMKILALTNLYPNPLQPHRAAFNRHRFRFLAADHELRMRSEERRVGKA